jgi:hypothetical protein
MKIFLIRLALIVFMTRIALSHGEDKKGPHGGFIRMPGAFHTELVQVGKNKMKVYLLDIEWKNPTVLRSSVHLVYKNKTETQANCVAQGTYYMCDFPQTINLNKKGELNITAMREEQKGQLAIYKLPLKLEKSASPETSVPEQQTDHSKHH